MPPSTLTVKIHVRLAWWWPIHRPYFALLIAAIRLGLLNGDRGVRLAERFAARAAQMRVGERGPWRPVVEST